MITEIIAPRIMLCCKLLLAYNIVMKLIFLINWWSYRITINITMKLTCWIKPLTFILPCWTSIWILLYLIFAIHQSIAYKSSSSAFYVSMGQTAWQELAKQGIIPGSIVCFGLDLYNWIPFLMPTTLQSAPGDFCDTITSVFHITPK